MKCFCGALNSVIFVFVTLQLIGADELHFDRIELKNASYSAGFYDVSLFRITKFNRTAYALNLNIEYLDDLID